MEKMIDALRAQSIEVETAVSGRTMSAFGSGGTLAYVLYPHDTEELKSCLAALVGYRYHVLGMGSNTLISDFGLGCVVSTRRLDGVFVEGECLRAYAGARLPVLAGIAQKAGLAGLEPLSGIPGSVGGACRSNAGAFGTSMSDLVEKVRLVGADFDRWVAPEELHWGYRSARFVGVVAEVVLRLTKDSSEAIAHRMQSVAAERRLRQPVGPSLGSVFKGVNGVPAARLIQSCGLKGVRLGGATVSGVHCNFIMNSGGATSRDYLRLAERIEEEVYQRHGVRLEREFVLMHD